MITPLNKCTKIDAIDIMEFLTEHFDYDFYFTVDNNRIYVTTEESLKQLLKDSRHVYTLREKGDLLGIVLLWKSKGGGVERYYVKLSASSLDNAQKLLSVLLWNIDKEVFVKLRKDSKYLYVYKNKGFRFQGSRGVQVLLQRKKVKLERLQEKVDECDS